MNRSPFINLFWSILFLGGSVAASLLKANDGVPPRRRSPDEVLVIYNENSPVSKSVALYYAHLRHVVNVVPIQCADSAIKTDDEGISLADYSEQIERPIRSYLSAHRRVQFIVLTKGIPLRIIGTDTGQRSVDSPRDTPLSTSLDSHLAALDYNKLPGLVRMGITGSGATGVVVLNRYWNANEPFSHAKFGGYLVTRLDGYTEADAKALVDRSLAADKGPGNGKILLDAQPDFGLGEKQDAPAVIKGTVIKDESPYSDWNADLLAAHDVLARRGIADELDVTETFIGQRKKLAGYFSWGSNDAKFSNEAYQSLTFAPGSICDTAVSTSARTFLPTEGGQTLLVDLIAHGLTCGKGYADEPLLQAIASPSIVLDRYTAGFTMVESFYAGSHFVNWQDIVVGDPLCCPYRH